MAENAEFLEKLRSLSFSTGKKGQKVTVDDHQTHKVEVTEHWNDRVDVKVVGPETVRAKPRAKVQSYREDNRSA